MHSNDSPIRSFEVKQWVIAGLGLLLLLGLSIILNAVHMAAQAEHTARFITRMIQTNDFREIGVTLEEARLQNFETIRYISDNKGKSFTLPPLADLITSDSVWNSIATESIVISVSEIGGFKTNDYLKFEYSRLAFAKYAFLSWLLLVLVSIPPTRLMKRKLLSQFRRDMELQKDSAKAELARKVRHNIRTPLAALIRLSESSKGLSQDERNLFDGIVTQVRGLISELDDAPMDHTLSETCIADFFRQVTRELGLIVPARISLLPEIEDAAFSARVAFDPVELKALLGNLVNNAVEAIPNNGKIHLKLKDMGHEVVIAVADNGHGMPEHIRTRATEKNFSVGKSGGSGLGLFHADQCAQDWGGKLEIHSTPLEGTTIELHLPVHSRESWYLPRIKMASEDIAIVVDDCQTSHQMLRICLAGSGFEGAIHSFSSAEEAEKHLARNAQLLEGKRTHFFADYDLGDGKRNGLEFLSLAPDNGNRYLFTGNFDQAEIRRACTDLGVFLVPKTTLPQLPVVVC